jgi:nicotinate-nucleotide adenylyltransferase
VTVRTAPRLGIFGGTFDPVHVGHVETAAAVGEALGLDRVLLVVANEPWQKEGVRPVTPAADRLAMVEAAVADRAGIEASRIEIDRGGPSYTVDTVEALLADEPAPDVTVVVGADIVPELATWKRWEELSQLVRLAVVDRPGSPFVRPPEGWRWVAVPSPRVDISSTELRRRLAEGRSVGDLVPEPVMRYICRSGLYAEGR